MSGIAEKIKAQQEELLKQKDALVAVTKSLEENPDDDALLAQVDELSGKVERASKSLDSLKRAEAALAERAAGQAPNIGTSQGKSKDAEELWVKQASVALKAHVERRRPEDIAAEMYPQNKALDALMTVQKSSVPIATTYTAGWAAELAREDIRGFLNVLTPLSVAAALASRSLSLDFGGFDSIKIPRRADRGANNNLGGAWVGEAGAIPVGRMQLASQTLSRYKLAVISTMTQELADRSTPAIESIVRQAILEDTSMTLDAAMLDALAAVAGVRPAGLLNGVTVGTGTAGGGADAVIADIKALVNAMTAANLGTRPVLLINSQDALSVSMIQSALGEFQFQSEINAGRLLGLEVIKSLNVPKGTAVLVDAAQLATAFDAPQFMVSDVATVVEVNADGTAPTMAATTANPAIGAVGTQGQVPRDSGIFTNGSTGAAVGAAYPAVRSLFQTYSIGIRMVLPTTWGLMRPSAVHAVNGLTW